MPPLLASKRFSVRLSVEEWNQLTRIKEQQSISFRKCLDLLVANIPEHPEDFARWMQGTVLVRRRWGSHHPMHSVSISRAGYEKLTRLAAAPIFAPATETLKRLQEEDEKLQDPANTLHTRLNRDLSTIIRSSIGPFVRQSQDLAAGDGRTEFFYKPAAVEGLGREVFVGSCTLEELPGDSPVLIDHSILLLASLNLKPVEGYKEGVRNFENDPFRPMSEACAALLKSANKRAVMIHPVHQGLFLSELAQLVKEGASSLLDGDHKQATGLGYLYSKARQFEDLQVRTLRLATDVPCDCSARAESYPIRLAVASAKGYLGTQPFVFASAFLPVETVEGVKVFCPADYPKRFKVTRV